MKAVECTHPCSIGGDVAVFLPVNTGEGVVDSPPFRTGQAAGLCCEPWVHSRVHRSSWRSHLSLLGVHHFSCVVHRSL